MNKQLHIYDCLTRKLVVSDGAFMTIGALESSTFHLSMRAKNAGSFAQRDGTCRFFPHSTVDSFTLNSTRISNDVIIRSEELYLLCISGACLVCWYGDSSNKAKPRFDQFEATQWFVYIKAENKWKGPLSLQTLSEEAETLPKDALITFRGLDNRAFTLSDIEDSLSFYNAQQKEIKKNRHIDDDAPSRCPSCWELFMPQDALAIASHPDLCGDPYLGEDVQKRFVVTKKNAQGLPIDEMGVPCTEFACPLCHYKLPPFFNLMRQHIFSLVGVPAAGKTYYLASLAHQLELELPRDFSIPFRDADPLANAPLSDMSTRLFTALTPQDAYIGKTRLEGSLYQNVWRHGHEVSMPRPFVYNMNKAAKSYSIVMFDNAGESFEPGRSGEEHPGAEHLAVASSILYLFDPTTNPGFRSLLQDNKDPQLKRCLHPAGRQGRLLAETEMRLRTRLNMPPGKKLDIPFALIIGKCDIWQHLLGPEALLPVVRHGIFHPQNVDANSARLRQLIFNICPYICINAEAISSNVRYFAASALGSSPIEFKDDAGNTLIGPASGAVKPLHVTDPMLWALNEVEPSLLPTPALG